MPRGEVVFTVRSRAARAARRSAWRVAAGAAVAGLIVLAAGCASKPPPPAKVSGSIQAAPALNPSVSQRPSPLRVLIYELKSAAAFNKADFMSLYQSDQAALGSEFVAREELMLQPGETRAYARTLAPETRFLGVVAIYRDLERATWRTAVAVQPGREQKFNIRADSLAVSASVQP